MKRQDLIRKMKRIERDASKIKNYSYFKDISENPFRKNREIMQFAYDVICILPDLMAALRGSSGRTDDRT